MCGIAGVVRFDGASTDPEVIGRMAATLRHRGPDDSGVWTSGPVGLASRRLAIQDVSPRGHMPMATEDERYHIVFNGEIYNFLELRAELERAGCRFRSGTDTEVILQGYARHGDAVLERLRGMFALAVWDAGEHRLVLARDRLGKKPLYYFADGSRLAFASEPKALLQDRSIPAGVDPIAVHHYLAWGYVPSPWSAFAGLRKLAPAHLLTVERGGWTTRRYWSLHYEPKRRESEAQLVEELRALLQDSTALRLTSDVPVGALLSGGVDSSAVVACMRRVHGGELRTFSIGFDEPAYDERDHALAVARHLETDHHALVVRPDAVALLPTLAWHYDEPFADSSAIPTFAASALARTRVTVALTGDGGDESFLGYDRYFKTRAGGPLDLVPHAVRRLGTRAAGWLPATGLTRRSHRLRRMLQWVAHDAGRRYAQWMLYFDDEAKARLYTPAFAAETEGSPSYALLDAALAASDAPTFVETAAHSDVQTYLPDDLLVKMDIASMAHSLEVRSPLLDHRVVEFAASLPLRLKFRGLTQKYLLKAAVRPWLPEGLLDRPKMGFGVPIGRWFREDLREMAYDVLLDRRARERGYFNPATVRQYLDEHMEGRHHHARLWNLLMLEWWHRTWIDQSPPPSPPERRPLEVRGAATR